jgi:SAM-dependent methyltransferase
MDFNFNFATRGSSPDAQRSESGPKVATIAITQDRSADDRWEKFANDDAYTYILTSLNGANADEFWRSGERTTQQEILPLLQFYDVRPGHALELGCGIGRLVKPLAQHFEQVIGVDIAHGMVQRAISFAENNGIKNVSFIPISGPTDLLLQAGRYAGTCDFIYSLLVFQHIPEISAIEGYLHTVRALLHERGIAYLQFDTRPISLAYRLKTWLPDFLLPRFWRRGIRRIRRAPEELQNAIHYAGLEIVAEVTPRTAYHRYILRLTRRSEKK